MVVVGQPKQKFQFANVAVRNRRRVSWSVKRVFPCQCIDEELSGSMQEPGLNIIVSGTAQVEGGYDESDELFVYSWAR